MTDMRAGNVQGHRFHNRIIIINMMIEEAVEVDGLIEAEVEDVDMVRKEAEEVMVIKIGVVEEEDTTKGPDLLTVHLADQNIGLMMTEDKLHHLLKDVNTHHHLEECLPQQGGQLPLP